jgi:hypothetical protein
MTEEIIWNATLDERYECKVLRNSYYSGQLQVFDNQQKKSLYDEEVRLSFGATFGPDVLDVVEWQNKVMEIVNG